MPTWIAEISATAHRGSHIALELSFAGFGVATAYWLGVSPRTAIRVALTNNQHHSLLSATTPTTRSAGDSSLDTP